MAESEQDRSEKPTTHKLSQARKKGAVARGMDLGYLAGLAVLLGYLWWAGIRLFAELIAQMRLAFSVAGASQDGGMPLWQLARSMVWPTASLIGFLFVGLFIVIAALEVVQTGIVFSSFPLKPDFSRLNPAQGLKRVFSVRLLIETIKNVLKMAAYSGVAWFVIRNALDRHALALVDAASLAQVLGTSALRLLAAFLLIALLFAAADQIVSRRQFLGKMRMSRREIKRENRDREGEPRIKQKRRQMHGEFVKMSQSIANLKSADVLIANPQHIAIALRYDPARSDAPVIVSSGLNALAQRMKHLALVYGIPIFEDRALAQALLRKGHLGSAIPDACFRPVADIYNSIRRGKRVTVSTHGDETRAD